MLHKTSLGFAIGFALYITGCEKVPTFQELTNQEPVNLGQPAANGPSVNPPAVQTPSASIDAPKVPLDPKAVIAEILNRPSHGYEDANIITLTSLPSGLNEIKSFNITRSNVTDEGVKLLGKLPELTELNLSVTRISGAGLAGLKDLINLKTLTLSEIQTLNPSCWDVVAELTQLETLNVASTNISDPDVAKLIKLPHLKELNVNLTSVTDDVFVHLAEFPSLEILRLETNSMINGSGLQSFVKSKNKSQLRELHAYRTPLHFAGFKHIKGISHLELLNVSDVRMNDQQLSELTGAGNIQKLNLSYNNLTLAGMKTLTTMKNLRELDLQNMTDINDACLGVLSKMKGLDVLNVTRTGCRRPGLQQFAKINKDCRLIFSDDLPQ